MEFEWIVEQCVTVSHILSAQLHVEYYDLIRFRNQIYRARPQQHTISFSFNARLRRRRRNTHNVQSKPQRSQIVVLYVLRYAFVVIPSFEGAH